MMYNNKLAVAIKANGKVLREFKDTVYIPFSSEYSILIKNLNSVRALVNITIDGDDVVPGGLVVNANSEVDLQRWIKNGNMTEGNRFKFIERTSAVENHRGVKLEDGLIRVEYQFERPYTQIYAVNDWLEKQKMRTINPQHDRWGPTYGQGDWYSTCSVGSASLATSNTLLNEVTHDSYTLCSAQAAVNEVGITVPGSKCEQKFVTVSDFPLETEKHVMVFKLLGETPDNKPVKQAVTVKHKPKCTSCGKVNKANAKFCTECGTALEIV